MEQNQVTIPAWGYELVIDAKNCDQAAITSKETIEGFSRDLVEQIKMKAYGDPMVVHFAAHDEDKAGYTLVQLIETSNITAHFCDKSRDGYLNIFSCLTFDQDVAMKVVQKWFKPESQRIHFFTRKA